MPFFHFNVYDGISLPDLDGHELPGLDSARIEAVKLSGNLIREMGPGFWSGDEWRLEVTDAEGLILFTLTFYGTVAPAGRPPSVPL